MAIHGTALGGGLELAMAGHYRVAAPGAQVGQPEVKLGIIPGAGGTQRLPRLAGVKKAVEMCAAGNPIKAEEALQFGIIDRIIEGDLLTGAIHFAREIAGKPPLKNPRAYGETGSRRAECRDLRSRPRSRAKKAARNNSATRGS